MISERDYIAIASRVKYDPITGLFTWAVSCGKISKGDIANYHNDAGYITLGKKRLRAPEWLGLSIMDMSLSMKLIT